MKLLPCPRVLKCGAGFFKVPDHSILALLATGPELVLAARRLQTGAMDAGIHLLLQTSPHRSCALEYPAAIRCARRTLSAPSAEAYTITIDENGVSVDFSAPAGFRAAVATMRQFFREFGRRLPQLSILDWPDFPRRGVMLDISRGRVPRIETLLGLVDHLADFKINEFQLYIEHTFAYRGFRPVWKDWGALTAGEIVKLDSRCRELGI